MNSYHGVILLLAKVVPLAVPSSETCFYPKDVKGIRGVPFLEMLQNMELQICSHFNKIAIFF